MLWQPAESARAGSEPADMAAIEQKFQAFLGAANAPGALDARTKRATAIALSVLARAARASNSTSARPARKGFRPRKSTKPPGLRLPSAARRR